MAAPLSLPLSPLCLVCEKDVVAQARQDKTAGLSTGLVWDWSKSLQTDDIQRLFTMIRDTAATPSIYKALFGHDKVLYILDEKAYICADCYATHMQQLHAVLSGESAL